MQLLDFLKFYWNVICAIPNIMRGKAEALSFWIGVAVLALVYVRPELAQRLSDPEMTKRLAGAVLLIGLGQAILRANYAHYKTLEKQFKEAFSLVMTDRTHGAQQSALGNFRDAYIKIMNGCVVDGANPNELEASLRHCDDWAYGFLQTTFNRGEASLLRTESVKGDLDLNAQALVRAGRVDLVTLYLDAQMKAQKIGDLIESRRIVSVPRTALPES